MKNLVLAWVLVIGSVLAMGASQSKAATVSHYAYSRPGAQSNSGNLGLGIMLGEPTGFTGKYWMSHTNAIDFGVTYSFGNFAEILADYLWHFPGAFNAATEGRVGNTFVPYLGVGLVAAFDTSGANTLRSDDGRLFIGNRRDSSTALGVRIPLGIEFLPNTLPIGIFAEVVPGMVVAPAVTGFFQGDIGIRFYL